MHSTRITFIPIEETTKHKEYNTNKDHDGDDGERDESDFFTRWWLWSRFFFLFARNEKAIRILVEIIILTREEETQEL